MTTKKVEYGIANREQIRSFTTQESNTYKVDYNLIHPDTSFNVREDYGDLEELANNILANGLLQPLIGDFFTTSKGDLVFIITDGFRRYSAIGLLIKRGQEVGKILCRVNEKGTSTEERYFKMFATQTGKSLTDIEISAVFRRLVNLGVSVKTISDKVSKSVTYCNNMLILSQQTEIVKTAITKGQAATTAVIQTAKEEGADRTKEIIEESIKNNKKFTVKESNKIKTKSTPPPQEKIVYEILYKIPETKEGMIKLKEELLDLETRNPAQRKFLNELIKAIDTFDVAKKEEVPPNTVPENEFSPPPENFYLPFILKGQITVSFKEFCEKYCTVIGHDMSVEVFNFFHTRTIEEV